MISTLVAGFVLGAAGSAHCAGMCGPLLLLVRQRHGVYQAGRLVMYLALGLITGLAGGVAVGAGHGRALSIAAGVALVCGATGVLRALVRTSGDSWLPLNLAIGAVSRWRKGHATAGAFAVGALTGLLPCGLVYAALGVALGLGDWTSAAGFMFAFWTGTLPALVAVRLSADRVRNLLPSALRPAASVALLLAGLLLIVRGVWLGHIHA